MKCVYLIVATEVSEKYDNLTAEFVIGAMSNYEAAKAFCEKHSNPAKYYDDDNHCDVQTRELRIWTVKLLDETNEEAERNLIELYHLK